MQSLAAGAGTTVAIRLPGALREHASGAAEVLLPARTVGEALRTLTDRHPPLRRHLFDDAGALRGYVNVYLDSRDVRDLSTPLRPGATLTIVPSVAGG